MKINYYKIKDFYNNALLFLHNPKLDYKIRMARVFFFFFFYDGSYLTKFDTNYLNLKY